MNSTSAQQDFDAVVTVVTKVITLFSVVVSCPFYLLVLIVIYKHRHSAPFNSEFFTIYIGLGIVDVTCYVLFIFRKFPHWHIEWFIYLPYNEPNVYMKILFFFIWWFAHAQFQLTILIGINRFVSVVMFKYYKKYWTSRLTAILIVIVMSISMGIATPVLFLDVAVLRYSDVFNGIATVHTVGPAFFSTVAMAMYTLSWKFHVYTIIATCSIFYFIMFLKIKEIRVQSKSVVMRREIRLLYPMTVLFVCNVLYVVYLSVRDYWISHSLQVFQYYTEWVIYVLADVYDLNNAYVIVLTSTEVRKAVLQFIFRSKKTFITSTTDQRLERQKTTTQHR